MSAPLTATMGVVKQCARQGPQEISENATNVQDSKSTKIVQNQSESDVAKLSTPPGPAADAQEQCASVPDGASHVDCHAALEPQLQAALAAAAADAPAAATAASSSAGTCGVAAPGDSYKLASSALEQGVRALAGTFSTTANATSAPASTSAGAASASAPQAAEWAQRLLSASASRPDNAAFADCGLYLHEADRDAGLVRRLIKAGLPSPAELAKPEYYAALPSISSLFATRDSLDKEIAKGVRRLRTLLSNRTDPRGNADLSIEEFADLNARAGVPREALMHMMDTSSGTCIIYTDSNVDLHNLQGGLRGAVSYGLPNGLGNAVPAASVYALDAASVPAPGPVQDRELAARLLSARTATLPPNVSNCVTMQLFPGTSVPNGAAQHDYTAHGNVPINLRPLFVLHDSGCGMPIMSIERFLAMPASAQPIMQPFRRAFTAIGDKPYVANVGTVTLCGFHNGVLKVFRADFALMPQPILKGHHIDVIVPHPQPVKRALDEFWAGAAYLPASSPHWTPHAGTHHHLDVVVSERTAVGPSRAPPSLAAAALPGHGSPTPDASTTARHVGLQSDGGDTVADFEAQFLQSVLREMPALAAAVLPEAANPQSASGDTSLKTATSADAAFRRQVTEYLSKQPHTMTHSELQDLIDVLANAQAKYSTFTKSGSMLNTVKVPITTHTDVPLRTGHMGAWRKYTKAQVDFIKTKLIDPAVAAGRFVWYEPNKHRTPWVHALVYTLKSNGDPRLTIDYRPLNNVTSKVDQAGLPDAESCLNGLAGFDSYISLDAADWFFQLPIRDEDIHKTGLLTPWGILLFKVLGQGQTNSSAYAQGFTEQVMEPYLMGQREAGDVCSHPYQDDSGLAADHVTDDAGNRIATANSRLITALKVVLDRAGLLGVRYTLEKCKFCVPEIPLLGEIVSKAGRRIPDERKVGIRNLHAPSDKAELASVLGLFGHFRKYIPNCSSLAASLTAATHSTSRWGWTPEQQVAFETLRDTLAQSAVLSPLNYKTPVYVYTDASKKGLAAWIVSGTPEDPKTFAFWSRKTIDAETRYPATDLEALAGKEAMSFFFDQLRYSDNIIWVTDHINLTWFQDVQSDTNSVWKRCARYFDTIFHELRLKVKILYNPGKEMHTCDAMSRCWGKLDKDCTISLEEFSKFGSEFISPDDETRRDSVMLATLSRKRSEQRAMQQRIDAAAASAQHVEASVLAAAAPVAPTVSTSSSSAGSISLRGIAPNLDVLSISFDVPADASVPFYIVAAYQEPSPSEDNAPVEEQEAPASAPPSAPAAAPAAAVQPLITTEPVVAFSKLFFADLRDLQRELPDHRLKGSLRGKLVAVDRAGITLKAITGRDGVDRLLIPDSALREALLVHAHTFNGHFAAERTHAALLDAHVIWPDMMTDCADFVKRCVPCARTDGGHFSTIPRVGTVTPDFQAKRPFSDVEVDFLGPFNKTEDGYTHVCVLVDKFSRYTVLVPCRGVSYEEFSRVFNQGFVGYFDVPDRLVHDGGPPFNKADFEALLESIGARNHTSHPKHAQSVGLVERMSGTALHILQKLAYHYQDKWDRYVPQIMLALNRHRASATGVAPAAVIFRAPPRSLLQRVTGADADMPVPANVLSAQGLSLETEKTAKVLEQVLSTSNKAAHLMAERYNASSAEAPRYKVGSLVFLYLKKSERAKSETGSKLHTPYHGPFKVVRCAPDASHSKNYYEVEHCNTGKLTVEHVSFMRPYDGEMTDLEAQVEARPVNEQLPFELLTHYDDPQLGTFFKVRYRFPAFAPVWHKYNTKMQNSRYDYFFKTAACQAYLTSKGYVLSRNGHISLHEEASPAQREAHELYLGTLANQIASGTTDHDLELEGARAAAGDLPTPAQAGKRVTKKVRITGSHSRTADPSEPEPAPDTAMNDGAHPPPLYKQGDILSTIQGREWGLVATPEWRDDPDCPGYYYPVTWKSFEPTRGARTPVVHESFLKMHVPLPAKRQHAPVIVSKPPREPERR